MKKIFQIIKWRCDFLDYPAKRELNFFNRYVTIGNHYPGVWSWGIEVHYSNGLNGLNKFYEYYSIGWGNCEPLKEKAGRIEHITIRFGKPIISIYLTRESRNRSWEAVKRYLVR